MCVECAKNSGLCSLKSTSSLALLLVCPTSSCSFSALRSLKNQLRNNMMQSRLNALAVCSVRREHVDDVDLFSLDEDFEGRFEICRNIFGIRKN
jgi:hypothetical protein